MSASSACASPAVTPGLRRPITLVRPLAQRRAGRRRAMAPSAARRRCATRAARSRRIDAARYGNWNVSGITARTVRGRSSMVTTRPLMAGSAAKRCRHSASLITTTSVPSPARNGTADERLDPEQREQPGLHRRGPHPLEAVAAGEVHGAHVVGGEGLDRPGLRVGLELRRRHRAVDRIRRRRLRGVGFAPVAAVDLDEAVRRGKRQRPQDHAVDDAEDPGRGAGRQRQRQHHDQRGAGRAPQAAQREARVVDGVVEPAPAPHIGGGFALAEDVAEPPRIGQGLAMRLHLGAQRRLEPAAGSGDTRRRRAHSPRIMALHSRSRHHRADGRGHAIEIGLFGPRAGDGRRP